MKNLQHCISMAFKKKAFCEHCGDIGEALEISDEYTSWCIDCFETNMEYTIADMRESEKEFLNKTKKTTKPKKQKVDTFSTYRELDPDVDY